MSTHIELLEILQNGIEAMNVVETKNVFVQNLFLLKHFSGKEAATSCLHGLSRRVLLEDNDIRSLIDEWENRDDKCLYQGEVEDIIESKDIYLVALSYRHVSERLWYRKQRKSFCLCLPQKDELPISKMSDEDQNLLVSFLKSLKFLPGIEYAHVWCDQIISTRKKNECAGSEPTTKWYNDGLLPYIAFHTLKLTVHEPEEILEKRLWIHVERSLSRMTGGLVSYDFENEIPSLGESSQNKSKDVTTALYSIAQKIFSGYWPEDLGWWKNDFQEMKHWALHFIVHNRFMLEMKVDDKPYEIDNIDIMRKFLVLSRNLLEFKEKEKPLHTKDNSFFYKFTAWNLHFRYNIKENPSYIFLDMGKISHFFRFTWWKDRSTGSLFGFLVSKVYGVARTVFAVKDQLGYNLHRGNGNINNYRHGEKVAGYETKSEIKALAGTIGIDFFPFSVWDLKYCYDNTSIINDKNHLSMKNFGFPNKVDKGFESKTIVLPYVFQHSVMHLLHNQKAMNGEKYNIENQHNFLLDTRRKWEIILKRNFDSFIIVKDATNGFEWKEGFNSKQVSFGFVDYLSSAMFHEKVPQKMKVVNFPTDLVCELNSLKDNMPLDRKLIIKEILSEFELTKEDTAMFVLSGGYSSALDLRSFTEFLLKTTQKRGYCRTRAICVKNKLQIFFETCDGNRFVAQISSERPDYSSLGIVKPKDVRLKLVQRFSVNDTIDYSNEFHSAFVYHEQLDDTASSEEFFASFKNSRMKYDSNEIFMLDMSSSEENNLASRLPLNSDTLEPVTRYKKFSNLENRDYSFETDQRAEQKMKEIARSYGLV